MLQTIKKSAFKSAHSGRSYKIIFAPPFLVFSLFAATLILQVPAGYVMHHFSFALGMIINQIVLLVLPVLVLIRLFDLTGRAILPFKKPAVSIVIIAVFMMWALAVLSDYLIVLTEAIFPVKETLNELYGKLMHVDGIGAFLYKFSFLCVMPSICEEIFFRGFSQTGLVHRYGKWTGITIVAVMFACAHLSPHYVPVYFVLGLFLGWIFSISGTLWIPVICHFVNNLWTFIIYSAGLTIPFGGNFGWRDAALIVLAVIVLFGAVIIWKYLLNSAECAGGLEKRWKM